MQMKETILLIKRIKLNFDMSKRYRRKDFQNLKRSKSQITINRSIARALSRHFNSIERERDYTSHISKLSEENQESQISMRSSRIEQNTQK
jgi:chorismate synthase